MKRLHVHVSVRNLPESIRFYSGLFAAPPSVEKDDYAKWMLEDPRVNFAISTRADAVGVNHLGIQVESADELSEIEERARIAGLSSEPEAGANCCYARSDKHWLEDPQGVVWEAFHTMGDIPVHGRGRSGDVSDEACCAPARPTGNAKAASCGSAASGCC
ncbi:glyoxalase/bleomycin resistance/dioxygenase family protein [Luteimonas marina]|uniref:Glyoxalase/bleomycin resistance/dioxygenase family protein n=1 Tax=Luteimonas marina TaxID=488485 RepID=A0A5C5U9S6_9GAMM|nr:ArsI/CadI family heavy metal resistance metalloenzyme [Luteimonas marina]TWT22659.1 glyoxalase/bleomycin resistance/dioxygenase family protein [Luteimonas marina]